MQVRMANHQLTPAVTRPPPRPGSHGAARCVEQCDCLAGEQVPIPMVVAPTSCHRPCPQHHVPESVLSLGDRAPCPVPLQVRNGTLSIAVVERASAGTYTCHASSKEGTITHTTRVLVQGKSGGSPSPGRVGTAVGHGGSHVTGVGFWGRRKCDGFWEQLGPFPVLTIPSCPMLQGHLSLWCHPRTSPSMSLKMPFWRARQRRTRETSPTPGSRAAAMSSTSGTAGMGIAPRWLRAPAGGAAVALRSLDLRAMGSLRA